MPAGATVIFSAHGVSKAVRADAEARGLKVFDATCPLATKVHVEVGKMRKEGREVVMIGHKGHPEVEGTMGQSDGGMYLVEGALDAAKLSIGNPEQLSFVTQTTLSVDDASGVILALRERFPKIQGPKKDDICYATQNRQDAVKSLAQQSDVVIVVGSQNSSNSRRLREVAVAMRVPAFLIDNASEIKKEWLVDHNVIGVTAGASAPDVLVQEVLRELRKFGAAAVRELNGVAEGVAFPLPKELA